MVAVQWSFSAVTNPVMMVNDRWLAIIISGEYCLFKAITAHIQWSYDFGIHVWKKTLLKFLFFTSQWAGKRPKQVTILKKNLLIQGHSCSTEDTIIIFIMCSIRFSMVVFCLFFENFIFFHLSGDENDLNLGVYNKLPNQVSNKQS